MAMTFGSAFAGIGGLDLGLERAGMTCRWQIEIDSFCNRILAKHWPGVKRYGNIKDLTGEELEWVDLICGGFPCQDLSQCGRRKGIEGTRSSVWFDLARLVGRLLPRYVLIENVPGLLVHQAMRRVVGELARCGYVGIWRCFRASDFGASHLRKRVFVLAYRDGRRFLLNGQAHDESESDARRNHIDGCDPRLAHAASTRSPCAGAEGEREAAANLPERSSGEVAHCEELGWGDRFAPPSWGDESRETTANGSRELEDAEREGLEVGDRIGEQLAAEDAESFAASLPTFAPGPNNDRWPYILQARPDLAPALESPVRGVVDGIPDWVDRALKNRTKRLGRLGNSVVPELAEWIGLRILEIDRRLQ